MVSGRCRNSNYSSLTAVPFRRKRGGRTSHCFLVSNSRLVVNRVTGNFSRLQSAHSNCASQITSRLFVQQWRDLTIRRSTMQRRCSSTTSLCGSRFDSERVVFRQLPLRFRLRWMASSSAEASSYAQGFGVTRRRDQPSLRLPPTRKASA
jgi:hypothetical protein